MQARVLSNAIWNAVNGSSSAVVAVLVPPFLTRLLTPEAYGAWALALQIGTYVGLFGFGIQMAVGRYVAFYEARSDIPGRDGIVATAFWFLSTASLIGWLAICGVAIAIHSILPRISGELVGETRIAIVLVGLGLAINLPGSIFAAVFTGRQRSDVPAKIQGSGRLIQAAALIAAGLTRNLAVLGAVYALVSMGSAAALWWAWRTRTVAPTVARAHVGSAHARELAGFCISLTLWNLAMLMVSGLDLIIVGRYDYAAIAFYAVGVTLVTLIGGTLASLSNALIPAAAALPHDDDGAALRTLLVRSSRLIMGASLLAGLPLIFEGRGLLQWWLGGSYADRASTILTLLAIGTIVRNAMVPYVSLAIGTGYQRKMTATPIAEGIITVGTSVLLAGPFGAFGVAAAKIIGGSIGVGMVFAQHPLKVLLAGLSRMSYLLSCIIKPAAPILPVSAIGFVIARYSPIHGTLTGFVAMGGATLVAVWFLSLSPEDRRFGRGQFRQRLRISSLRGGQA